MAIDGDSNLPENVDASGTYMVSGEFINSILDEIRKNRIVIESDDSPLRIREIGPGGTVLGIETAECNA